MLIKNKIAVTEMNFNDYCLGWTFYMKYAGKPSPTNNNNIYYLL